MPNRKHRSTSCDIKPPGHNDDKHVMYIEVRSNPSPGLWLVNMKHCKPVGRLNGHKTDMYLCLQYDVTQCHNISFQ